MGTKDKKPRGRPRYDGPPRKTVTIDFTLEDLGEIDQATFVTGESRSAFVRRVCSAETKRVLGGTG